MTKNSKITILTGAGATKPWGGLLTDELTSKVLNTTQYQYLTKKSSKPIRIFLQ